MSRSVIENHPKKQEIIDAILAGESLRKIAVKAGVSHIAVNNYKKGVVLPSLEKAAKIAELQQLVQVVQEKDLDKVKVKELTSTLAAGSGQPLVSEWWNKARYAWEQSRETLEQSRKAQRVGTDKDGSEVFYGQDFGAVTGALNQVHRNLELTGRASGVLSEASAGGIHIDNMLVVMPRAGELPEPASSPVVLDAVPNTSE